MPDSMKTEVEIVPHKIEPGRKLKAQRIDVNNFYIHSCLTQISESMAACCESQSANAKAELVPSDVANLQMAWSAFKQTFDFSLLHNDPPSGSHEDIWPLWIPSKNEIASCPNTKIKIVLIHLMRLCQIMGTCDSAKFSGNIAKQSEDKIKKQIAITEAAISLWLGSGKDNSDTGIEMPSNIHTGVFVPDVDMDQGFTREPSAGNPGGGLPDFPDTNGTPQN